ncbi:MULTISPECIES: molybdopterin-dependent oxidoreductase [Pseudanabaena]|uniref:Oxidoreductase molybdopterin binding protein n=2 Tax=Pseudanabaena TaxID=1152 RepID=L8N2J1_9CYAN|nr:MULTISPECIES: molybdopterin-dependent oxidoreductase [Pseudanabaena]ELS32960.1 oxidoreductase molybdopterin binding protein [Pseudanabaena biceps PCC 7429]MDG3494839.1 molybdopterin-dependent oxidoreductase [Pseudanabaena catenata USMAC16]
MQFDQYPRRRFSRRQLMQYAGLSGMGLFLGSCGASNSTSIFKPLHPQTANVRALFEPLNQGIEELIFQAKNPAPEYPVSAIEPNALLINSFDTTPVIDPHSFKLIIDGAVNNPLQLNMNDVRSLPLISMVIRHVCVEGWAAIVQWGGVRLYDLAKLVQPKAGARYVYFESADSYYESWDIASALHPQTILAYQKNGSDIPVENGAPLRLASPIKLGYKQSKWVTRVTFTNELRKRRGYWVDEGYEWFAGL